MYNLNNCRIYSVLGSYTFIEFVNKYSFLYDSVYFLKYVYQRHPLPNNTKYVYLFYMIL